MSKFFNFGTGGLLLFDPSLAFGGRLPPSFLVIDVDEAGAYSDTFL